MTRSRPGKQWLGDLDAREVSRLVEASSDVALVLDDEGTILQVLAQDPELLEQGAAGWRGRTWGDTVTVESRQKVQAMLADAEDSARDAISRWRQVNHPTTTGPDLPVMYAAIGLPPAAGQRRRFLAFGRDMRATVALQRKLVEAQQAMERDYWRLREAETRYRHLFETSGEAVLILDGATQKVIEANPAAVVMAGASRSRLIGATLAALIDPLDGQRVQDMLAAARAIGRHEAVRAQLAGSGTAVLVSASVFRQDTSTFVLLRLLPAPTTAGTSPAPAARRSNGRQPPDAGAGEAANALWHPLLDALPDALVVCDDAGIVSSVNRAFVALAELSNEDQARGQSLDRWLGRTGVELGVLIATLRERGNVAHFATELRGQYGSATQVEVAASVVQTQGRTALAFSLRDTGRRLAGDARGATAAGNGALQRSASELAELVGRTPMKDIVAESTDVIEQMCIQTALQMTGDNRASAAQLLGLSRQSLYVKLRRFGILEGSADEN